MEARSLASLNRLAADPPQYPKKPSEEDEEPLTLYISRVPGTSDVILSTFKPQIKNVTGQDVVNSLYYVHLEHNQPDGAGSTSFAGQDQTRLSEDSPSPQTISRKPLPLPPRPPTPDGLSSGGPVPLPPIHKEIRKPVARSRGNSLSQWNNQVPTSHPADMAEDPGLSIPHHLLGQPDPAPPPPPPHQYFAPPVRKAVGPNAVVNLPIDNPAPDKTLPSLPADAPLAEAAVQTSDYARGMRSSGHSRSPSPKKHSRSSSPHGNPFTLTLIRRDPGTGSQWNVGKVSSRQVEPPAVADDQPGELLATSPTAPPQMQSFSAHPSIDVQLETSGYDKFRLMPKRANVVAANAGGGETAAAVLAAMAKLTIDDSHSSRDDPGIFSRQVAMEYSKSWTSNLRDKFQRIDHSGWPGKGHSRNESDGSVESVASGTSAVDSGGVGHAGKGMKARGYFFTSPWDGKCEFRTGNGGRSLRCHHILHDGEPAPYNPLVADKSAASAISELRFNLPGSELFPDQSKGAKSQIRGHFNKLLRAGTGDRLGDDVHVDDDDDQPMSPFDINVGSEDAGGGNRGKRAKLGKLIVYSDGLKMLDLVVAANIGVWWGAWERSF